MTWIAVLVGRLVAVLLGGVLMLAGFLLCLTVIGAIIGIPLAIRGSLLALRGLF